MSDRRSAEREERRLRERLQEKRDRRREDDRRRDNKEGYNRSSSPRDDRYYDRRRRDYYDRDRYDRDRYDRDRYDRDRYDRNRRDYRYDLEREYRPSRRGSDRDYHNQHTQHRERSYYNRQHDRHYDRDHRSRSRSSSSSASSEGVTDGTPKDSRTLFVSQLVQRTTERDLRSFFRRQDIRTHEVALLRDRSGQPKGSAYVELRQAADRPAALALSNRAPDFQRFPIRIVASEAKVDESRAGPVVVQVTNLHPSVTSQDLQAVFGSLGSLSRVVLDRSSALLHYTDAKDAHLALQTMRGQILKGQALQTSSMHNLQEEDFPAQASRKTQAAYHALAQLNSSSMVDNKTDKDDPTKIGNAHRPTRHLWVRNMFDKNTETEPGWEADIRAEFVEECRQFGTIEHVQVLDQEEGGQIYASFATVQGATQCAQTLAGRWFDQRQLRVSYVNEIPK